MQKIFQKAPATKVISNIIVIEQDKNDKYSKDNSRKQGIPFLNE